MQKIIISVLIAISLVAIVTVTPVFAQTNGPILTLIKAANKKITVVGKFVSHQYGEDGATSMVTVAITKVSTAKFKKILLKKNVVVYIDNYTDVKGDPAHLSLPSEFTPGDKLNIQVKVDASGKFVAKKVLNLTLKANAQKIKKMEVPIENVPTGNTSAPVANADGYFESTAMSVDLMGYILLVRINGSIYNVIMEEGAKFVFNGTPGASFSIIQMGDTLKIKGKFCTETKNIYASEIQITH